jgi:hypothetical protein
VQLGREAVAALQNAAMPICYTLLVSEVKINVNRASASLNLQAGSGSFSTFSSASLGQAYAILDSLRRMNRGQA